MINQDNQMYARDSTLSMRVEDSQTKLNMVDLYTKRWVDDDELNQCKDNNKDKFDNSPNKEVMVD